MARSDRNPFVYGGPVDVNRFVGRQHEVNLVFEQVTSAVRGSVAVIGERRIGKTSLLHYVSAPDVIRRWTHDEQSSIFLFIDCGAITPMTTTRFWQDILTRLKRELERRGRYGQLAARIAALLGHDEIRTAEIEFLIEDFRDESLLLVILLDEFEWVVRIDAESESNTREAARRLACPDQPFVAGALFDCGDQASARRDLSRHSVHGIAVLQQFRVSAPSAVQRPGGGITPRSDAEGYGRRVFSVGSGAGL